VEEMTPHCTRMADTWKRRGADWLLYSDRRLVGRVVPDPVWPGMYRAKLPGGLSDMVNLSRAKDAVLGLRKAAELRKNVQRNQGPFLKASTPVRQMRRAA
jgi:hypothetical protein